MNIPFLTVFKQALIQSSVQLKIITTFKTYGWHSILINSTSSTSKINRLTRQALSSIRTPTERPMAFITKFIRERRDCLAVWNLDGITGKNIWNEAEFTSQTPESKFEVFFTSSAIIDKVFASFTFEVRSVKEESIFTFIAMPELIIFISSK